MNDINTNVTIDFNAKNNAKADPKSAAPLKSTTPAVTRVTTTTRPVTSAVATSTASTTTAASTQTTTAASTSTWMRTVSRSRPYTRPVSRNSWAAWTARWTEKRSYEKEKVTSEFFLAHKFQKRTAQEKVIIQKDEEPVRLYALWWLEQIWVNMMFFEYKNDIIIVDAGLQFASASMHGVSYLIPDVSYLVKKKKNIKAIFITHGHLDHIGALRHILEPLGWPTIYTTPLTLWLIKKLFDDQRKIKNLNYKLVNPDVDIVKEWCFTVEFFRVNHNIPETMGMAIHTPKWLVVNTADFKIDHTPAIDKPADLWKIARIGQEWVKLMLCESTNASKPGHTKSEKLIWETLDSIIKNTKWRQIVSTFASNIGRIIQMIESAVKYNKVVFLAWRSMINNVELCIELWYISVPKWMIRKVWPEIETMPEERVLVLCTWSQWEEFSALVRMTTDEFKFFTLRPWDNIVLSTHTIPGNERSVNDMINKLVLKKVNIIDDADLDIHASGHWYQGDIKTMLAMLKPNYYSPIHGEPFMRNANKMIALDMDIPEEHILLPNNGQPIELYDDWIIVPDRKLRLDTMMVDGKWVWHLSGEYVIKARQIMAEDGVVNLVFKVDTQSKDLVWNIQIESRWFVYSSEVKKMHTNIVEFSRKKYNSYKDKNRMSVKDILRKIKDELGGHINKIIGREPMIIPMFVYINRDAIKDELENENEDEAIIGMTLEEQGSD